MTGAPRSLGCICSSWNFQPFQFRAFSYPLSTEKFAVVLRLLFQFFSSFRNWSSGMNFAESVLFRTEITRADQSRSVLSSTDYLKSSAFQSGICLTWGSDVQRKISKKQLFHGAHPVAVYPASFSWWLHDLTVPPHFYQINSDEKLIQSEDWKTWTKLFYY